MSINNEKIFIDSSIIVEYLKGVKVDLLNTLLNNERFKLCISQIVVSEFLFHSLAIYGGKSPLSLKMSGNIGEVLKNNKPHIFLNLFDYISDESSIVSEAARLMTNYNLLPNDALIISLCILNNIKNIASFDKVDLTKVCNDEGLTLISSVEDLNTLLDLHTP